jgi:DNA-binding transcriptional MerR regulator
VTERPCSNTVAEEDIPPKAFYTIGEVSRLTGVRPHVLRYWEEEGKLLKPGRRRSRHRLYRPADIQLIFEIKRLREEEKLSLAAMRRQLHPQPQHQRQTHPAFSPSPQNEVKSLLQAIRDELLALKEMLD